MASTATGIEALTVRPGAVPVDRGGTEHRPKSAPSTIARGVNSAGDWLAGTYGLEHGRCGGVCGRCGRGWAIGAILADPPAWPVRPRALLQSPACEQGEQSRSAAPRQRGAGLRAHDQPPLGVPALPQHARSAPACGPSRRRRSPSSSISTPRRSARTSRTSASSACAASATTSRICAASPPDPRPRPQAARRRSWAPATSASRLPTIPASARRLRDRRAVRHAAREGRPAVARRRADLRHPRSQADRRAAKASRIAVIAVPARRRRSRGQPRRRRRHQGDPELFARRR